MSTFEEFKTMLEFSDVEPLIGVEVADFKGLR